MSAEFAVVTVEQMRALEASAFDSGISEQQLQANAAAQVALVAGFAAHAGSALESNLSPQFRFDVLNVERSTFNNLPPQIEYYEIWPWLAGLVLATVVFEGWLAWRK